MQPRCHMQRTGCIYLEPSIISNNDEKKLVLVYMSSFPGFYGEGETTAIARSNAAAMRPCTITFEV